VSGSDAFDHGLSYTTFSYGISKSPAARSRPYTAVSLLVRCLLDKVAEQILFDLWRADFPNTTVNNEEVMNIDEGHKKSRHETVRSRVPDTMEPFIKVPTVLGERRGGMRRI
jgi:hypothetical protein